MESAAKLVKRNIHRGVAHLVAWVLRPGAVWDPHNFRLWERRGYHITPLHFYYPIPDTRAIEQREFRPSALPKIDLRPQFQLCLLKDAFAKFSPEYGTLPIKPTSGKAFYLGNDAFSGIDPHVYYSMIRHFQPKTVVEVGSGYSTLLGVQACRLNGATRYVCIDPWPRAFIAEGVPGVEFRQERVEDLDLALFQQLERNDILFVDSSHVIRTAGDVCFMMLEVLPRLAKGVIVHFHDIYLPFDTPKTSW